MSRPVLQRATFARALGRHDARMPRVLIVDDEENIRLVLRTMLAGGKDIRMGKSSHCGS